MTIRQFMQGADSLDILCAVRGEIVRRLTRVERNGEVFVRIDAFSQVVAIPADTKLSYQAWVLDRGSILFPLPGGNGEGKLCTEFDILRFPDGREDQARRPTSPTTGDIYA